MSAPISTSSNGSAEDICLLCGLCCSGVIFADVKLQPEDDAAQLHSFGLPVAVPDTLSARPRFSQPCAALDGCRCRIYAHRPKHCRDFVCVLLGQIKANRIESGAALRIVRTARERADKVRRLLRLVGDTDETAPLSRRFRRTARRLQKADLDEDTSLNYSHLTLAVHDLNLLLREAFYP